MEALDSIEKRIDSLTRILGAESLEESKGGETLQDAIVSANTLISSALSGRQPIIDIMSRSDEIEKYLDPDFLDQQQELKTKEIYLNAIAPDLADSFDQLEQIKRLEATLGAEYFRTMPDESDKLHVMNETTVAMGQKNDALEEMLTVTMQRYDELQNNLKESLRMMSERIEKIEKKLKEKKKDIPDA